VKLIRNRKGWRCVCSQRG